MVLRVHGLHVLTSFFFVLFIQRQLKERERYVQQMEKVVKTNDPTKAVALCKVVATKIKVSADVCVFIQQSIFGVFWFYALPVYPHFLLCTLPTKKPLPALSDEITYIVANLVLVPLVHSNDYAILEEVQSIVHVWKRSIASKYASVYWMPLSRHAQ